MVAPHHQKILDEQECRACGTPYDLDPAHTIPKSLGGKMTYDSVMPLCRTCHDAQHDGKLELLGYMTRAEQVEAVRAVGLARAWRYLTQGGDHA
jgi:5-methylcytosine-specific restriction endonuclease McrA